MNQSKKAIVLAIVAFLIGCAVGAFFIIFGFSSQSIVSSPEKINPLKVVAMKVAKMQPKPVQQLVKETQYDEPSYFTSWVAPSVPPKIVLLCIHGMGLHSDAFKALGQYLAQRGYPTYSMDVRGFGRYMKDDKTLDFESTLSDVGDIIKQIKTNHPRVPIVLVGESMGGAIAIQAGAQHQSEIAGIIASAPGDLRYKAGTMNMKVGLKLITRPNKRVDWGDQILAMATSNTKLQDKWRADPLVRLKLSPNELLVFQNFMGDTGKAAEQIQSLPMLFLHGRDDDLMKLKGTVDLFTDIPASRKDLFILGQREHVMLEEGQFDHKTIDLVETWLANSLKVPKKPELAAADKKTN